MCTRTVQVPEGRKQEPSGAKSSEDSRSSSILKGKPLPPPVPELFKSPKDSSVRPRSKVAINTKTLATTAMPDVSLFPMQPTTKSSPNAKTPERILDMGEKKVKKKKPKPKREKMTEGEICSSSNFHWKVVSILGSGGFGDVYRVIKDGNAVDKTEYAMKTELVSGDKRMLRLKIEVESLIKCNEWKNRSHFVEIVDRGKTEKFKFMVMTLVGSSLEDYRKKADCDFTNSTAYQISIQTIEAVRDFHQAGWLHRDIKPQNFAYGLGDKMAVVYILDFGIAKRIFDKDKQVKKPRARVKFLGTLRFASRTCHHCIEQGRKDDLETWLYMVFDIFDRAKGLAWKREPEKSQVIMKKELFCRDKAWYTKYYEENCPILKEMYLIIEHLNELDYYDEPRYDPIKAHLIQTAKKRNVDLTLPLDWMVAGKEEKKPAAAVENGSEEKKEVSEGNKQVGEDDEEEVEGPFARPTQRKRRSDVKRV